MRLLFALCGLLLCYGLASAQDASTYPGQYAEPFTPRLLTPVASPGALPTPFLTLDTPPLTVGASNSTLEDAAGSRVFYNQPLLYEPGMQYNPPAKGSSAVQTGAAFSAERHGIELGSATFQSDYGVAQLAGARARKKATRVYTNPDVAAVNDANGTIKFRGKLEHVN